MSGLLEPASDTSMGTGLGISASLGVDIVVCPAALVPRTVVRRREWNLTVDRPFTLALTAGIQVSHDNAKNLPGQACLALGNRVFGLGGGNSIGEIPVPSCDRR